MPADTDHPGHGHADDRAHGAAGNAHGHSHDVGHAHRRPTLLGFAAGAPARLGAAAVFATTVTAALLAIGRLPAHGPVGTLALVVESTAAVAAWTVTADGVDLRADATHPLDLSWSGPVPAGAHEVTVEAHMRDARPAALRLSCAGTSISSLAWGSGTVSGVLHPQQHQHDEAHHEPGHE